MAVAIKVPKPSKTGTPVGMEGVRPGSVKPPKATNQAKPSKPPKKPGGAPFSPSFNPDGTTTLKPPVAPTAVAPPPAAAPTPAAAPGSGFNYANAFYADPRYATGLAGITQTQLGIGSKYGLTLNRDTDKTSPTYGMVKYRVPGTTPGQGNITAKVDPQTGAMTYSDASGKPYSVADLELDVIPVARGEAGYLEGALGQAAAGSEKRQFEIGDVAAKSGARRSGMRAQASAGETGALQSALRNLSLGAAGEFGGTTSRYADLLNTIYPDLLKNAEAYATAPVAAPTPEAAPVPAAIPAAAPTNTNPVTESGLVGGQALSAGPSGQFMGQVNAIIGQRDAPYSQKVASLNALRRFALTPQQLRWITTWIANNR